MKFKTKGFISLLMACCFTVAAFSGVILYMTPRGRVANWTGWNILGLGKHEWAAVHINACLLTLIIAALHLFMNWKVFWRYIKTRSSGLNLKTEMAVAGLLTAALVAGTIMEVPPLTAPLTLNNRIKNYWETESPSSPTPHAEEFTLVRFATTIGVPIDALVSTLQAEGLHVDKNDSTIAALAEQNEIVPSDVYRLVRQTYPEAAGAMTGGPGRGRGQGRGCEAQGAASHEEAGCAQNGPAGACDRDREAGEGNCAVDSEGGEGHGPGMGWGRGMGLGRGMGQGRGAGRGRGMGPGWMQSQGQDSERQHEPEQPADEI